jgi:hypothetical protein
MSGANPRPEPRRSRWLPAAVISVFAAMMLADVVVFVLYGNYRNLIEDDGLEVIFTPANAAGQEVQEVAVGVSEGSNAVARDGTTLVEVADGRFHVFVPGKLAIRFRAPDAGSWVKLEYRFGERRAGARCELVLARVASRHGVDYMCRKTLDAKKKPKGRFRQYLADHAGWFELSFDVNPAAAGVGFEVAAPEIVRD